MIDRSKYADPSAKDKRNDSPSDRGNRYRRDDVESSLPEEDVEFKFATIQIRHNFMRKVYFILLIQLAATIAIMCIFKFYPNNYICRWLIRFKWVIYIFGGMGLCIMLTLVCCTHVRHIFPVNFILLALFTICQGSVLGILSCRYETELILTAIGITAIIVVALSFFAIQTRCDFTVCWGLLLVSSIVLIIFSILMIFIRDKTMGIVFCCLGVLIFGFYLVYDTQLILCGKHSYSLSPDEYILGAIMLYIDIFNMFLYILMLLGIINDY